MPLSAGTRLGPYEIVAPAGAGGMGEVYKARDTRLDRTVAIKVLPSEFAFNADLRQRLEREARSISKLSHPHICTLYDIGHQDGTDFLVMEYLEGETLQQRLQRASLPTTQLLEHGVEIADALDKAHRLGIVHRDLKPGNIMLTKSGAKLLDFGLAKFKAEPVPAGLTRTEEATEQKLTAEGVLLGTLQYMAPEQLEGGETDARTDIFALGLLLYEMATGQPAFTGKSKASLIAAILSSEPEPIISLQPTAPPALERVVKKCLAKNADDRWQSAADLASELRWLGETGSQAGLAGPLVSRRNYRERVAWASAAVLLVLAAAFGLGYFRRAPGQERAMHFSIALPSSVRDLALSPDGRLLAFIAPRPNGGGNVLWVHEIGSAEMRVLENTEGGSYPFWSPDGRSIGFFADGKLKRIEAAGGPAHVLCDASFGRGGAWNRDGVIVFAPNPAGGLARVSAAGGAVTPVTEVPAGSPHPATLSHRWPSFLPDGKHFAYSQVDFADLRAEANAIYVAALDSKEQRQLVSSNSNAIYVPPGYLVFSRTTGTLMAQRFDADRLQLTGEPSAVANDAEYLSTVGRSLFSISQSGTLVYQTAAGATSSQLQWFDRNGKRIGTVGAPASYANPRVSPDGKKVAMDIDDPQSFGTDIWIVNLGNGVASRLTFEPGLDETPIWSPDGNRILWLSQQGGGNGLYLKRAAGSGNEKAFFESLPDLVLPNDWSSDGRFMLYTTSRPDWILQMRTVPMTGERKRLPFVHSQSSEKEGQFSPDGHWVAYSSNESGRWQVYVAPFPGPGGKYQVSTNGGQQPRWRRDGKELFFLSPDKKLMAVPVKAGTAFEFGQPTVLFQTRAREPLSAEEVFTYDVSTDGQRFLINVNLEQTPPPPVNIVLNWREDLPRK